MIVSYDIDGVLAEQPPPNKKKWGHMNGQERNARKEFLYHWYMNAAPLINPSEPKFYAISARKRESNVYKITKYWLNKYYKDRVIAFYLLNESRSIQNVIQFKSSVIKQIGIKKHYEDNKKVLKGMRKILPSEVELYFWEKGMAAPLLYKN